ncbi:ovochymase-1 isoform X2 [Salarias fasciatus]|uniref:ovochymase-1 isoform X2 n=1 Tax=Salarias fasciatus TaxID=181472 RepID=UPI001176D6B2|nr:transmembrane protease serine 9-like isoform X2 [Salarias fasciatus]
MLEAESGRGRPAGVPHHTGEPDEEVRGQRPPAERGDMLLVLASLCLLAGESGATGETDFSQKTSNWTDQSNLTAAGTQNFSGEALNPENVTLNGTVPEPRSFSGHFNFSALAGVRSFVREQEAENRIMGGQEAWAHSWPWQVSLRLASTPACGGAVVSPLWVVSAAHCFRRSGGTRVFLGTRTGSSPRLLWLSFCRYSKASVWTVLAGKHDLDNLLESGQQLVGVSSIISHHDYNFRTKSGDVALLRLQQPLVFNQFVRPIDLWMSPLPVSKRCTVTGWGSTQENGPRMHRLQEVNVTVLPSETCNRYYSGRIRHNMFCAGKDQGGVDACQGDSGGPLSCFTGIRHELAGLVSWGIGCGRAKRPGVYTRVQQYADWMSDTMNAHSVESADNLLAEEDPCGKQQSSGCDRAPGLAEVLLSDDGKVSVGNVSESCPFLWPWQVSLQSNGRHYCSGVLIHRRWVLTARHCSVRAKEDVVVLGVHDVHFLSSQSVVVDEVFNPPLDAGFPPRSDLSLLRLSVAARIGPNVSPVCVPEEDEEPDHSWSCVTAGWGAVKAAEDISPDRLHHTRLTLVNETGCKEEWGDFVGDSHICCHPAGSTSCLGDAGAPLFCQKRGTYFLFGMASWGSWRCDAQKPAVLTKVPDFCGWIHQVTQNY